MVNDKNVVVGWSTYSTLANIYTKHGQTVKAFTALKAAEERLSSRNRLGYFFLITLYAALSDRDSVLRLWESSKKVAGKVTCANYMCIILCLVKVGDLIEAEKVFKTWESQCRNYDVRVSNVLLGAYVRRGWMDKAESLHFHTLEKGGRPNYKTWEILIEGWVKSKEMSKAVEAMKKGFTLMKFCVWRPSHVVLLCIMMSFEEQGNADDARKYVKVLRHQKLMTLPLYKSYLRTCIQAQTPAPNIPKITKRDKVDLDEEILALIQCVRKIDGVDI
uniref:Pentatricopeptide repeat-containing protein At5g27460 n=1 Tax=Anthurium amnicola TaxID=1678845 RepID=A0A1D1YL74_9ARAE